MSKDVVADSMRDKRKKHEMEGKIPLCELPIGKFADLNGSVIYRYESVTKDSGWIPGCWLIEKHNHLTPYDELVNVAEENKYPWNWQYFVKPIDNPKKKHIDNAIAILRDSSKKGLISGLCYLEHINSLKELLRAYGKKKDNV